MIKIELTGDYKKDIENLKLSFNGLSENINNLQNQIEILALEIKVTNVIIDKIIKGEHLKENARV